MDETRLEKLITLGCSEKDFLRGGVEGGWLKVRKGAREGNSVVVRGAPHNLVPLRVHGTWWASATWSGCRISRGEGRNRCRVECRSTKKEEMG